MLVCPVCNLTKISGYDVCASCGAELEERPDGVPPIQTTDDKAEDGKPSVLEKNLFEIVTERPARQASAATSSAPPEQDGQTPTTASTNTRAAITTQALDLMSLSRLERLLAQVWREHKVAVTIALIGILAMPMYYLIRRLSTALPTVQEINFFPPEIPLNGTARKAKVVSYCNNPDGSTLKLHWSANVGDIKPDSNEKSATLDVSDFEPTKLPFEVVVTLVPEDSYRRLGTGLSRSIWIVRPPSHPPQLKNIETKPNPAVIKVDDSIELDAAIENPDNIKLHYNWYEKEGRINNDDFPSTTLLASGINTRPNTDIIVKLTLTDQSGGEITSGQRTIKVIQGSAAGQRRGTLIVRSGQSNVAPIMYSFQANRSVVYSGESVSLSAVMMDPNENLNYTWSATGGQLTSSGPKATLNTTGVEPSTITVNLKVKDEIRGGSVSGRLLITVLPRSGQQAPPPASTPLQAPSPTAPPAPETKSPNKAEPAPPPAANSSSFNSP